MEIQFADGDRVEQIIVYLRHLAKQQRGLAGTVRFVSDKAAYHDKANALEFAANQIEAAQAVS